MALTQLTLIGKPGCHLCDDAHAVVTAVLSDLEPAVAARLEQLSILDDAALAERFADDIPVLMIDGQVHSIHRVDAAALRARIMAVPA
ncbi:MAG: glutaredoxin family protein [Salinibacterium sp.]|nr:glutaredoxin family protein [Salinibacterium sp.]